MGRIKFTDGCPNNCPYCYEPTEIKVYDPSIPPADSVQILDMNFLANPNALKILESLPKKKYELICGIDYRLLTLKIAKLLKYKGFIKIRWAWDYSFNSQKKHRKILLILKKAGFRPEDLSVFILVNWKIPYVDCVRKLDLLKVWGVKVNDCCYDGGYSLAKPEHWNIDQIKKFRAMSRKHNQLIRFKIDPEY